MSIDKTVSRETGKNFRYQMLLLRILGDYPTKLRYAHDQQLEKEAYEALQANEPVDERLEKALNTLRKTWLEPVGVKERFQMQRLADELYRSCKIQLTTTRHKGQYLDRGAWLDTLNMALNDFQYLHQMPVSYTHLDCHGKCRCFFQLFSSHCEFSFLYNQPLTEPTITPFTKYF